MSNSIQNEATSLLNKLGVKIKNSAVFSINGMDFQFNLDPTAYDDFVNSVESTNKITPMRDYLLATVEPSQRMELAEVLQIPGVTPQLMGLVQEQLIPKLNITLKN